MSEELSLFDEHENMESGHRWKASYAPMKLEIGTTVDIFVGLECECGVFIHCVDLSGIINHYYGNRIHLGVIKDKIVERRKI